MLTIALLTMLVSDPVAVPLQHDGKTGIWFTLEEANRLNRVDLLLPLKEERVQLLETNNEALQRALKASNEKPTDYVTPWYRAPILWFSTGLVLGAAAIVMVR